jgi:hypothetical protein
MPILVEEQVFVDKHLVLLELLKDIYYLPKKELKQMTLFVEYRDGADDKEGIEFIDGETLILEENITYVKYYFK